MANLETIDEKSEALACLGNNFFANKRSDPISSGAGRRNFALFLTKSANACGPQRLKWQNVSFEICVCLLRSDQKYQQAVL